MAVDAPPRPTEPPAPAPPRARQRRPAARASSPTSCSGGSRWRRAAGARRSSALIAYTTHEERVAVVPRRRASAIFADDWDPAKGQFGAGAMIYGTFLVGSSRCVIAVPVSIGIALFVTEVAPRRLAQADHLRRSTCSPRSRRSSTACGRSSCCTQPLADFYAERLVGDVGDIPMLEDALRATRARPGSSYMTAGIIVAIMITPIITSLTREVFATTPASLKEAALRAGRDALGDDPRRGVPAQPRRRRRGGMIGLGRAIGETIAVALRHRLSRSRSARTSSARATRWPSIIANQFGEATGTLPAPR